MENSKIILLLAFCQIILIVKAEEKALVPALYVFGSSSVDAGNNNHLDTVASANHWPYAIDFNNKRGRFSNGRNLADFAAMKLGLPSAPAYLDLTDSERSQTKTGINYGSGACGILNTTRVGGCLSVGTQITYFTSTVRKDLPKQMNENDLKEHLAKSIFLIFGGVNDYKTLTNGNTKQNFTGPDYADHLLQHLSNHIQALYDLGARKFVVHGVSTCKPEEHEGLCISRYYLDKLPGKLSFLQRSLSGSFFTMFDTYAVFKNMEDNHEKYGIIDYKNPCFVNGTGDLCPDRTKYHLFDNFGHLTEISCKIAMNGCFNGTICTPYTLFQLANVH